jgi:hypothetical protein
MPTEEEDQRKAFGEGFAGATQSELAAMPDAELAQWQAGWKPGTEKHILAEKEWVRRLTTRQLQEQYRYEERLARANRWWSIGAATLGIVGTLAGAWFGAHLEGAKTSEHSQSSAVVSPSAASKPIAPGSSPSSAPSAGSQVR